MDNFTLYVSSITILIQLCMIFYILKIQRDNIKHNQFILDMMKDVPKEFDIEEEREILLYSKQLLEHAQTVVNNVSMMKYKQFEESHDMSKINEANIRTLIEDVSTTVHTSINMHNINFDKILFTQEFYENYIIMRSIFEITNMLEKEKY